LQRPEIFTVFEPNPWADAEELSLSWEKKILQAFLHKRIRSVGPAFRMMQNNFHCYETKPFLQGFCLKN
jgi:hypothetical protein